MSSQNTVNKKLFSLQNDSSFINETNDSSIVKTKNVHKGLFFGINAETRNKRRSLTSVFSYGIKVNKLFDNAIILTRPEVTPTVSGKTTIRGNLLSSKKKINKGKIFGVSRLNKNYLNGEIIIDEDINPKLFNETLIKKVFEFTTHKECDEELYEAIGIINELKINKFKNSSIHIPNDISIEGLLEKGIDLKTLELIVKCKIH